MITMALNLFPKLPQGTQIAIIIAIAIMGIAALFTGNQEAFNMIIVNNLLVHSGLIGQSLYEINKVGKGQILQGVPAGSQGIYMADPKVSLTPKNQNTSTQVQDSVKTDNQT